MNRTATILICMTLFCACAQVDETRMVEPQGEKQTLESSSEQAMRVSLASLEGERPILNYEALLDEGHVVEIGRSSGTATMSSDLRKGLLVLGRYRTDQLDDDLVRVQRFGINHTFPAARLLGNQVNAILPFRIRGDADVEFARWFEDRGDMVGAAQFSIMDIPYNAETALRLPVGTVVTIPIEANVSFDVGGQFIRKAFNKSGQVLKPLSASMRGNASAIRQGTLFGKGQFSLQFIRLPDDRVRVRMLSAAKVQARSRLRGSSSAALQYFFVPSSHLGRLRAFRRHIERTGRFIQRVRSLDDRLEALRAQLPDAIRATVDSLPVRLSSERQAALERNINRADRALEMAQNSGESVAVLDEKVAKRADQAISRVESFWDSRVAPVTTRIQRWSSRVYRFDQMVQLQDGLVRQLRLLGDFEFDLSDDDARVAFEHAVSGKAVWRGVEQFAKTWNMDEAVFSDFTLANTLATEDQETDTPRVRRLALGSSDLRERTFSLEANGLGMTVGLDGAFESNRVEVTDQNGSKRAWHTRAWERGQRSEIFGNARSESFASGAFTAVHNADITRGGYWFRWKKTYGDRVRFPVANALAHTINDLGPAAMKAGIPALYQEEHVGKVEAELFVVVNQDAMAALFDPDVVDESLLWSVLGDMMDRYQRPLSLPYAHAPIRPQGLDEIEGARDACESVARRLGGRYCYSFKDRIFPALQRAQDEGGPAARLEFFESFYRVPLGGATLSTRVLVRYLAELFEALEIEDPFTIQLKIRNLSDDSEAASPTLIVGDPLNLTLSEATALEGIMP